MIAPLKMGLFYPYLICCLQFHWLTIAFSHQTSFIVSNFIDSPLFLFALLYLLFAISVTCHVFHCFYDLLLLFTQIKWLQCSEMWIFLNLSRDKNLSEPFTHFIDTVFVHIEILMYFSREFYGATDKKLVATF